MLVSRILTALVLLPLAIGAILYLPNPLFALVFALIVILGADEWRRFIPQSTSANHFTSHLFTGIVSITLLLLWYIQSSIPDIVAALVMVLFWLFNLGLLLFYPASSNLWRNSRAKVVIIGILLLSLTWYGIVRLHAIVSLNELPQIQGPALVLLVMMIIWVADTGAYFSGRTLGKHKLAPSISPGKTWEGVLGGLVLVFAVVLAGHVFYDRTLSLFVAFVVLMTFIFSVIGDLFESMFKRETGIKDSGNLLPGHGGVLDRIDSVTAAVPVCFAMLEVNRWLG